MGRERRDGGDGETDTGWERQDDRGETGVKEDKEENERKNETE